MARVGNQKRKLLLLYQYLLDKSDESHPVTVQNMIDELARHGISAERKSIYSDLEELRGMGYDVQSRKGVDPGWFIGARDFELAELKLLVDAVRSSHFLTARKSDSLIRKLAGLTSQYQARQLQGQVYMDRRIKAMNESIFYNVDRIHNAIASNRMIQFRYFDFNVNKERVFRREGKTHLVSPCGLFWDSENYYLVGLYQGENELRHYRVDKMSGITLSEQTRVLPPGWDPESYARRHFGMYSGLKARVRVHCRSDLAGVVIDRFGQDVIMVPDGPEWFTVTLDVVVSPPFWGWMFTLGDRATILSPDWVRAEYLTRLQRTAALQAGGEADS